MQYSVADRRRANNLVGVVQTQRVTVGSTGQNTQVNDRVAAEKEGVLDTVQQTPPDNLAGIIDGPGFLQLPTRTER